MGKNPIIDETGPYPSLLDFQNLRKIMFCPKSTQILYFEETETHYRKRLMIFSKGYPYSLFRFGHFLSICHPLYSKNTKVS
jgi:hypothetical protein